MLAALVTAFGPPETAIKLTRRDPVSPGDGDVDIAVTLAAINPSDLIPVTGAYSHRTALPFVPGFEGVGTILRIGAGVTGLKPGDRVVPIGASGLWQQRLIRPASACFAVPNDLSDEEAATAYINPLTAFLLIGALETHCGRLEGLFIAVTAANSAIGRMLVALLSKTGARLVALVRGGDNKDDLGRLFPGIDVRVAGEASGDTFDAALDAVGGLPGASLLHQVRPGGIFIQYGALSGRPIDPAAIAAQRDVQFRFLWLRSWAGVAGRTALTAAFERSFEGIRQGFMRSRIAEIYPLEQIDRALAAHAAPSRRGKILLAP